MNNNFKKELEKITMSEEEKQKIKNSVMEEVTSENTESKTERIKNRNRFGLKKAIGVAVAAVLVAGFVSIPLIKGINDDVKDIDKSKATSVTVNESEKSTEIVSVDENEKTTVLKNIFNKIREFENKNGVTSNKSSGSVSYEYDSDKALYEERAVEGEISPSYSSKSVTDVIDSMEPSIYIDSDYNELTPQAGTLTAGFNDDNLGFAAFTEYISDYVGKALTNNISMRAFVKTKRVEVTLTGSNNAKIALLDSQNNPVSYGRTNAEGKAYIYYADDKTPVKAYTELNGEGYFTDITDGKATFETTVSDDSVKKIDLMLMVDTTGSMRDELRYINEELKDIVSRIASSNIGADIRVSVNFYRDHGDDYTVKYYEFTDNIETALEYISAQNANGGGDAPEAVDEALVNVTEHAWRDEAVKVCFFVLDAPAHPEYERQGVDANIEKAIADCAYLGIRVCPITASGADDDCEITMRSVCAQTGGKYIFITDDSGIGYSHKTPDNVQSDIYALNELMIKVVNYYCLGEEITGKPIQ